MSITYKTRIASAAKNRNWKKVSKLSRFLTKSYYAKLLAVRKVTNNKGSKTPGVDGILWKKPADKMRAALKLTSKGYHAKPLLRKCILKKNGKLRPLRILKYQNSKAQTC